MRRSKLEILSEILKITSEEANITSIVYKANLNFKIARKHVEYLLENGFIEEKITEGKKTYSTTKKGKEFLSKFAEMKSIL